MSIQVKAAAATGGAVLAAGGGGYGLFNALHMPEMPKGYQTIQSPTNGKFGQDFQKHFVDADSAEKATKNWWEWSYKYIYWHFPNKSSEFKNIKDSAALKNVCKTAYGKTTRSDISPETDDINNSQANYEKDIWTYCSVHNRVPVTVGEEKPENSEYKNNKKKKFISVKDKRNDKFWEIQADAFYKKTVENQEVEGIGKDAADTTAGFKDIYAPTDSSTKTVEDLKNTCEKRYKATYEETKDKETLKFCSLQGKQD
ncbi:hypothetical protein [Candidatus Mycoplasma haematohominis]|uniref:hypothetical protein n=1 Tax=Candidatus Mycoplasma haematohominis TaxID=1494318 RepID=UPI001C0A6ECB|nr:hypothetical protein [Candidatus Mycoplasma haemohominis]